MREVRFQYGILAPELEKQANAQDFTLQDKAEFYEKLRESVNILYTHSYLKEKQADKLYKKIHVDLVRDLKEIK